MIKIPFTERMTPQHGKMTHKKAAAQRSKGHRSKIPLCCMPTGSL